MDLGGFLLLAAWFMSLYGAVVGFIGARRCNAGMISSARNSLHLMALFSVLSLLFLSRTFYQSDFRNAYVWQNSNKAMHPLYKISAVWGGMDGSMLLWAAMMALLSSVVVWRTANHGRSPLFHWVTPVLCVATNFFLMVVVFLTNPFRLIPTAVIPPDGNGLNPLLQNPSMLIHPPLLYAGFTGFVVPFAFCIAALLSGQLDQAWTKITRRWTLIAWGFLTAGIILGGNWAYIELGWGGFWAWDPVENASFLPWLTGTAYIHSVMVEERRGMLRVWNVFLALLTYTLTIFGTFLTRSGVVQSVHAFASADVGWVFLVYMFLIIATTFILIAYRWSELKPENKFQSYLSRETAFLMNNVLFLGICFATFWGVLFPIISEAVTGEKSVVGPPFFNAVNVPLFILLLLLMGIAPLLAWKKTAFNSLFRLALKPLVVSSAVTLLCLILDPSRLGAAITFGLSIFVLYTVGAEFHRGAKVRSALNKETVVNSYVTILKRKPQRYGGLLVHAGVAVMAISIAASMVYKIEEDFSLRIGETYEVGRFSLILNEIKEGKGDSYNFLRAKVTVFDRATKDRIGELHPERRFYPKSEESTTEVSIRTSAIDDLYLALAGFENPEKSSDVAVFKVFVNPLQVWLWVGAVIVLFGTVAVIGPGTKRAVAVEELAGLGSEARA